MNSSSGEKKNILSTDLHETPPLLTRMRVSFKESLQLYHQWWKEISLGIFIRLVTLISILYIASVNPTFPDINDMNELLTQGLVYMFQGLNPYNREYVLTALALGPSDPYTQYFINYGPGSLLFHIPCMVYPYSIDFAGFMDFQPSFMILHGFFDFLLFDRIMRHGNRTAALFVWINPILVTLNFVTHMSVVIFLLWMGYEKWKDPFWSIFWLGLGAITYQYIGLILLFAIVFHFRSYHQWILGVLPSAIIFGAFQLWASIEAIVYHDPSRHMALVNDLLLVQFNRPYEAWPLHIQSWWSWTGSVPAIIFNVYWILSNNLWVILGLAPVDPTNWAIIGDPLQILSKSVLFPEGIRISTLFSLVALIVSIYLLVKLLLRPSYNKSILYSATSMGLFLLGAPAGIWHHNFIIIIPLFYFLVYTREVSGLRSRLQIRDH